MFNLRDSLPISLRNTAFGALKRHHATEVECVTDQAERFLQTNRSWGGSKCGSGGFG